MNIYIALQCATVRYTNDIYPSPAFKMSETLGTRGRAMRQ